MAEKHLTGNDAQEETYAYRKQRNMRIFQAVTLIFLALLWTGYLHSLYRGNDRDVSSYPLLILIFSLFNQDVLFKGENVQNTVLNILAKAEGILFFVWVMITVIQLIWK